MQEQYGAPVSQQQMKNNDINGTDQTAADVISDIPAKEKELAQIFNEESSLDPEINNFVMENAAEGKQNVRLMDMDDRATPPYQGQSLASTHQPFKQDTPQFIDKPYAKVGAVTIPKVVTNQEILERKLNNNQKNKFLTHFQKPAPNSGAKT